MIERKWITQAPLLRTALKLLGKGQERAAAMADWPLVDFVEEFPVDMDEVNGVVESGVGIGDVARALYGRHGAAFTRYKCACAFLQIAEEHFAQGFREQGVPVRELQEFCEAWIDVVSQCYSGKHFSETSMSGTVSV